MLLQTPDVFLKTNARHVLATHEKPTSKNQTDRSVFQNDIFSSLNYGSVHIIKFKKNKYTRIRSARVRIYDRRFDAPREELIYS